MSTIDSSDLDPTLAVPSSAEPLIAPKRKEAQEQFRQLMDHLEQVFWVTDIDTGSVDYVSPAYETIWGRTCQTLYDEPRTLVDSIHVEDRERMVDVFFSKIRPTRYDEEFRIVRPDGEVRWIWGRGYPVKGSEGHVGRFAGIAEDVTEKKVAAEEQSRLAAIIEYSDDAVLNINVDGIIIGWNSGAERQYGYAAEELLGRSISMLYPPGHHKDYVGVIERLRAGELTEPFETVRRRKDGTLVDVRVKVVPILGSDGEVVGASQISRDIAQVRRLEAQFIEAQKLDVVGRLATGIAHDFNNFLAVIMSYSELLAQRLVANDPSQKYASEIQRAAERAGELTRQLLVFSRRQLVEPVVLELNDLVAATATMMRRLLGEAVELSVVTKTLGARIVADSGYVGQLIMNLAINARDAMPEGGKLTIATGELSVDAAGSEAHPKLAGGDYVVLNVTDTGTGMTDEVKRRLFEPFFTTKEHGTGLGLATCLTIAQQSSAQIEVATEPGRGTTFSVYFPSVDERAAAPAHCAPSLPLQGGTEKLLVVEDDPAVLEMVVTVLVSLGYEVLEAVNGQDGLRVARENSGPPIRLVLTDATMPIMSGKVMVDWLRATYPDIRVLFTSGYNDEIIAQNGAFEPGMAFLSKPYTLAAVAGRVRELLDTPF